MIKEALKEQVDYLNTLTDYTITTNDFSKILVYLIENKIFHIKGLFAFFMIDFKIQFVTNMISQKNPHS